MPAESGLIKNAAVFPTSSMVTFLRMGDVAATALKILPKSLMPEAARVLMGPALMPLTLIFLGPKEFAKYLTEASSEAFARPMVL